MWRLKVLVQFILAHLPFGEKVNFLIQRAVGSFAPGRTRVRVVDLMVNVAAAGRLTKIEGGRVVEIGTGWDALGALALYLVGAKATVTYDHVAHLRLGLTRRLLDQMEASLDAMASITAIPRSVLEERLARLKSAPDLATLLGRAGVQYVAPGDAARTQLQDHSIDLVFSFAVLEHVPQRVVHELAEESRRILKPGGLAVHYIGMQDHYARQGSGITTVNFLKYSPRLWRFFGVVQDGVTKADWKGP